MFTCPHSLCPGILTVKAESGIFSLSQSSRSLTGDLSGSWCKQNRGIIIRILGRNALSLRKQGLTAGWESPEVSCLCPLCEGLSLRAKLHGTKWQIKLSGLHCLHLREQPEVLLGSLERGALGQLRLSTQSTVVRVSESCCTKWTLGALCRFPCSWGRKVDKEPLPQNTCNDCLLTSLITSSN